MRDEGLLAVGADRRICPMNLTVLRADTQIRPYKNKIQIGLEIKGMLVKVMAFNSKLLTPNS